MQLQSSGAFILFAQLETTGVGSLRVCFGGPSRDLGLAFPIIISQNRRRPAFGFHTVVGVGKK